MPDNDGVTPEARERDTITGIDSLVAHYQGPGPSVMHVDHDLYDADPAELVSEPYDNAKAEILLLRELLAQAREELARWGWGDFHYGTSGQEQSVVTMLAKIDGALAVDPNVVTP